MAEFQEIVREFHRLCETQRKTHKNTCDKCPIKIAAFGTIFQCHRYVLEEPEKAESIITAWAAEHPEPVYPTWAEWLHDNGIILDARQHNETEHWLLGIEAMRPIPADIAEKLGLQPKEAR